MATGAQPETADDAVDGFNHTIKVLVSALVAQFPNDATMWRAKSRCMLAIQLDPTFVVGAVGAYLFSYQAQIYQLETDLDGASAFFLESQYDRELRESVDNEKADLVQYIMPKLKEYVRGLGPAQKKVYADHVVSLLDNYLAYVDLAAAQRGY